MLFRGDPSSEGGGLGSCTIKEANLTTLSLVRVIVVFSSIVQGRTLSTSDVISDGIFFKCENCLLMSGPINKDNRVNCNITGDSKVMEVGFE